MKRILTLTLLLFGFVCAIARPAMASDVVVTIKPLHSLVSAVMGETGTPVLLLDKHASPHGFRIKPSHIRALHNAKVIFYIDAQFESFLKRPLASLPSNVRVVAMTEDKNLLMYEMRAQKEAHDHEHHHGMGLDYHIWLSPINAKHMIRNIANHLGTLFPEHANTYQQNAADYIVKIDLLNNVLANRIAPVRHTPYVVFHDAYQYFEHHYGLANAGVITFEPNQPSSAKRIKHVRHTLKETEAKCVFREPQFSDRITRIVIEGSSARSGTLDPVGAELNPGPALYLILLDDLGNALEDCLGSDSSE